MVRAPALVPSETIEVDGVTALLLRKRVKNVTLRVYPPDGRVVVSAPPRMSERAVAELVRARRDWIERHRRRLAATPRRAPLRYVDGERLSVLGRPHVLSFGAVPSAVAPADPLLLSVPVRPGAGPAARRSALIERLRKVAQEEFTSLVALWAPRLGVATPETRVRRMTSRWGTCHVYAGKVFLNLALVTRRWELLEYVVVHELAHLLVPDHSRRFWSVVERHQPDWRSARAALAEEPLWADPLWGPSAEVDEVEQAR